MVDALTPELISLAEALGTICTLLVIFYFSRKEMKTFSMDIETHVLNNLDEKLHDMAEMILEKPELMELLDRDASSRTPQLVFAYYILYMCSYAFHMRRRRVLSDNEWNGWLRWMRTAFQDGKISELWQKNIEPEKWFDPDFQEFLDKEIIAKVSSTGAASGGSWSQGNAEA